MSIASGLLCIGLSLWTRMPIVVVWSTPGAALLVTSLGRYPYAELTGVYVVVAIAITASGASGWFGRIMRRVPGSLVSAMLAGILFSFGTSAFRILSQRPAAPAAVLLGFLIGQRVNALYAVPTGVLAGFSAATFTRQLHARGLRLDFAQPHWTTPGGVCSRSSRPRHPVVHRGHDSPERSRNQRLEVLRLRTG